MPKDVRSLGVGDLAPDFTLLDDQGKTVTLKDLRGRKNAVLIFYPGDDTPGCTRQLCAVRDDAAAYEDANAVVLGINPGNRASHVAFKDKYGLTARLLIDTGLKTARKYKAVKKFFGRDIVHRTVIAVGTDGRIRFYRRGTPSTKDILASLQQTPQ